MNCAECKELLVLDLEGLLEDAREQAVMEHLESCESCRAEWKGLAILQQRLVNNGKTLAESDLEDDVMNRIIREQGVRLKSAAQAGAGLRLRRQIMRSPIARFAVAAVVVVAVVIGIYAFGGSQPAFAEIVRPILAARTAVFRVVTSSPDQPAVSMDGMYMEPGLGRHTMKFGDRSEATTIHILDYVKGRGLVLVPAQKTAMVIEFENQPDELNPMMMNAFKVLRDRILAAREREDENVEYLGESHVNGRPSVGYRLAESGTTITIWAETESLLPLQIEFASDKTIGKPVTVTMMDIQFDVPLDPAKFSTEVPEGYTAHTMQADVSVPSEVDVVEMLSLWVKVTGKFPSSLTIEATKELEEALQDKGVVFDKETALADPAFRQRLADLQKINRSLIFVRSLAEDADWHYAGADAAFGDEMTPIFWYRPEGAATYRVIYADLSVADVALEDLPE